MEPEVYVVIIFCVIFSIEYISLVLYTLYNLNYARSKGIQPSLLQKLFLCLVGMLSLFRILGFLLTICIEYFLFEIMEGLSYLTNFNIYSLICYSWYVLYRLSLYLSNIFHLSESYKAHILNKAKQAVICLDVIGIISFSIIIGFRFRDLEFEEFASPKPISYLGFRIHQLIYVWINYLCLICMGITLMRQISKYSTEKPFFLIISLYVILADFTYAIVYMNLLIFERELFSPSI